jgi:Cft2 family RNA processing exonuclease
VKLTYNRGLCLPEIGLWMDAHVPRPVCVVSHAHSDHIARHEKMIATPATARLAAHRQGAVPTLTLPFGERRELDGYAITLFPAGHCLGSAQALVECRGERIVYTGDFKLRPSRTSEPPVVVPCDTLIMEVTFGEPRYVFPPEAEVTDMLCAEIDGAFAVGEVPIVYGYTLGKSQEALALLVERGYQVAVHASILAIVDIYRDLGVSFDGPGSYERLSAKTVVGRVVLAPPNAKRHSPLAALERTRGIYLSGWAMHPSATYRFGTDRAVPLSDHAGYDDLLRYAADSGARRVITVHGTAKFAQTLERQLGVETCHLDRTCTTAATQMGLF